jgi:uncharacterized membrane protein
MKLLKDNIVGLLLTIAAFAVVLVMYPQMPEVVPTHWNIHGVADGHMAKPLGPFVLPLTMVGVLAIFALVRAISPREAPVERFARAYSILASAVLGFLLVLTFVAALIATGTPVNMTKVVMVAVGVLFVVIGNFMGKVTRNYFVGIRTPWTLSNDEVWYRTHRLGGKVFVVSGLAVILAVMLGQMALALPVLLAAAAIPVVYSYLVYRRLTRASP